MALRTVGLCASYNGVCLQDCELLQWDHRIEYDEGHNQKWDIVQITLASMVVSNAPMVSDTSLPADNSGDPYSRRSSQALDSQDRKSVV